MIRGLAPCVAACAKPLCGLQGDEGSSSGRLSPPSATRHRCRRATHCPVQGECAERIRGRLARGHVHAGWARSFRSRTRRPTTRRWSRTSTMRGLSRAPPSWPRRTASRSRQSSGAFRLRVHADHQGDAHVFSRTLIQYRSTCACPARVAVSPRPPLDSKVRGDNLTALIPVSPIPHLLRRAESVIH